MIFLVGVNLPKAEARDLAPRYRESPPPTARTLRRLFQEIESKRLVNETKRSHVAGLRLRTVSDVNRTVSGGMRRNTLLPERPVRDGSRSDGCPQDGGLSTDRCQEGRGPSPTPSYIRKPQTAGDR